MAKINFPELGQSFAVGCKKPKGVKRERVFVHLDSSFSNEKINGISTKESKVCMRGKVVDIKHC